MDDAPLLLKKKNKRLFFAETNKTFFCQSNCSTAHSSVTVHKINYKMVIQDNQAYNVYLSCLFYAQSHE